MTTCCILQVKQSSRGTSDTAATEIPAQRSDGGVTHRFISTDGVDLSPKHDCSEDQKEEALEAEKDDEDDCCRRREAAALWGERKISHIKNKLVSP